MVSSFPRPNPVKRRPLLLSNGISYAVRWGYEDQHMKSNVRTVMAGLSVGDEGGGRKCQVLNRHLKQDVNTRIQSTTLDWVQPCEVAQARQLHPYPVVLRSSLQLTAEPHDFHRLANDHQFLAPWRCTWSMVMVSRRLKQVSKLNVSHS